MPTDDRRVQRRLKAAGFQSLTDLAGALRKSARDLEELPKDLRTLATYLSNLDRGDADWFTRRPRLLSRLATLLRVEHPNDLLPPPQFEGQEDLTGLLSNSIQRESALYNELRRLGVREDVCLAFGQADVSRQKLLAQLESRLIELEQIVASAQR